MRKKYLYLTILGLALIFIFMLASLYFRALVFTGKPQVASSLPSVPSFEKESATKLTAKQEVTSVRKQADAPLKLLGILLGEAQDKHAAVIKNIRSGKQGSYKIGERVALFTVKEISFEQVTLERDFTHEKVILMLEGNNADFAEKGDALAECLSPNECLVRRRVLKKKAENINELLQDAKALPSIDNGKIKGFKIQDLASGGIAEQLRLKEGDVIKAVNDEMLDGLHKPFVIYSKYRNSPFINLQIEREGGEISILYKIK